MICSYHRRPFLFMENCKTDGSLIQISNTVCRLRYESIFPLPMQFLFVSTLTENVYVTIQCAAKRLLVSFDSAIYIGGVRCSDPAVQFLRALKTLSFTRTSKFLK